MKQLRQSGAALLAAMLTVSMVATFAAAAMWQQWRSVEIEAAERTRVQSSWILTGALDWSRLILREDNRGDADHLGEPWAVPLQEARLSTFLAAEGATSTDSDADNVFLSGQISDLQGFLNVSGLVDTSTVNANALESFRRLFGLLGLPQAQLDQLAANLRFASDVSADNLSGRKAALAPQSVDQLVWLGLSLEAVEALRPYVTVLPNATRAVNINTASAEVIYAAGKNFGLADAQQLVAARERQHFKSVQDAMQFLPDGAQFLPQMADIRSNMFEVRGRLRIGDAMVEEVSMVQRAGREVKILQRKRTALTAAPANTPR